MSEKIICYSCKELILEKEYVNVNEFFYHLEHFNCCECSILLI